MTLSLGQIIPLLQQAGFSGDALNYAVKIMGCESGYNPDAHNVSGEDSRGLMQINLNAHPEFSNLNLYDPLTNLKAAYQIFVKAGYNFKDWTCAKNLNLIYPTLEASSVNTSSSIFLFNLIRNNRILAFEKIKTGLIDYNRL